MTGPPGAQPAPRWAHAATRRASRCAAVSVVLLAVGAAGCASAGRAAAPTPLPSPDLVRSGEAVPTQLLSPAGLLARGAWGVRHGYITYADSTLQRVWSVCGDAPAGRRALLLLAAARLDPDAGVDDPEVAARAAARYLALPGADGWTRALARQLYLISLELGATPVRPGELRSGDVRAPAAVPTPDDGPRDGCALRGERADGSLEVDPLPQLAGAPVPERLARLETRLAALQKELDRIRKTIHP